MTGRIRLAVVGALASALGVLTLAPVTQEHDWLVPAAIAIAIVAAVGLGLRRVGVPPPLVIVAQLTALVLWLGVLVAADVAWFGVVPTVSWARRMGIVFTDGISAVLQYAAPVAVTRGILLLLVGGAGLVALLVDFAVGLRRAPLTGIRWVPCTPCRRRWSRTGWPGTGSCSRRPVFSPCWWPRGGPGSSGGAARPDRRRPTRGYRKPTRSPGTAGESARLPSQLRWPFRRCSQG